MDLSQQIDLSSPDSKPPKPIGLGFGLSPNTGTKTLSCASPAPPPPPVFGTSSVFPPATYDYNWSPFNSMMVKFGRRMQTFQRWPKQMAQHPIDMVKSGFFYSGNGDSVTCFFCGITLRDWESVDNINFEHKKFSPNCKYLTMACEI